MMLSSYPKSWILRQIGLFLFVSFTFIFKRPSVEKVYWARHSFQLFFTVMWILMRCWYLASTLSFIKTSIYSINNPSSCDVWTSHSSQVRNRKQLISNFVISISLWIVIDKCTEDLANYPRVFLIRAACLVWDDGLWTQSGVVMSCLCLSLASI